MISRTLVILLTGLLGVPLLAQTSSDKELAKPEAVLPMPYEEGVSKTEAQQNTKYWADQVSNNGLNKNALLNLVIANRQLGTANFYLYNNAEVLHLTDTLSTIAPNSFEAQYATFLTQYPTESGFVALENANNLAPANVQLAGPLMEKALIEGNSIEANKQATELVARDLLDPGLVEVANDVSISTEKNSIIFCEGEMDCYPLFAQQAVNGTPNAGTIIVDRQLLGNSRYRVDVWQKTVGSGSPPEQANATVKGICENTSLPTYLTLSIDRSLINTLQSWLYVTGNAFQYSKTPIKNIPILEKNWSKMDGQDVMSPLNANYLVPAIVLKNHYEETGQVAKAVEMEKQVKEIAEQNGKEQQLKNAGIIKN